MAYNPTNPNGQAASISSAPVVLASDQSAIAIKGNLGSASTAAWTSSTTSNTAVSININVFNAVSVTMSNASSSMTAGAITFEVSPDSTTGSDGTWFTIAMARVDSFTTESSYVLTTVANRAWTTSVDGFKYFRVRLSTVITGTGTATINVTPQTFAIEPMVTVGQSAAANLLMTATQSGTWNVNSVNVASASGTGLTVTRTIGQTTALVSHKTSAARLYSYYIQNPGGSDAYLHFFNATSVTLGTTVPIYSVWVPAGGAADSLFPVPITFGTALTSQPTTTMAGTTSPSTGINVQVGYI